MAGLEDLLGGALGGDAISKIAAQLGTSNEGASKAIGAALPQLLGKVKAHADDPVRGAQLAESLRDNNGEDLDDLDGVLQRSGGAGAQMVNGLLGDDADSVHDQVASESGLNKSQAAGLMGMLGPLVMGAIGKSAGAGVAPSAQGMSGMLGGLLGGGGGAGGLGGLLGGLLGGGGAGALGGLGSMLGGAAGQAKGAVGQQGGGAMGGLGKMLDRDGDGSIVDDVANMAGGAGGQRGGLVGKLLGMLGKKR